MLVYSTCTFSVEENEAVIGSFLADNDEAELLDISEGEMTFGISGNSEVDEKVLRVMPHKLPYDGFFIAALRRRGDEADGCSMKIRRDRQLDSLFYELPANFPFLRVKHCIYRNRLCSGSKGTPKQKRHTPLEAPRRTQRTVRMGTGCESPSRIPRGNGSEQRTALSERI
ncbi:MAG: hypothetical protein LRY51_13155 [Geovibrio sp.]|nr:hypothetical protein [Geovibrio sp.]